MNRTVAAFGLTSLLSDAGHEMATSVLPLHLARLGLGATALGFVAALPGFVVLRSVAWVGRGFRGPLRDFLVSYSVEPRFYARAFGVERAGDLIGAVVGPVLALTLLAAGLLLLVAIARRGDRGNPTAASS